MMGIDILNPRTVVAMSILLTSMRIRGRNLYFSEVIYFRGNGQLSGNLKNIYIANTYNFIGYENGEARKLTGFLRRHFYSRAKSIGPLHPMHSNRIPSWATFAWRSPHTR